MKTENSYKQVWFPTWSNVDGQDDICWYPAKLQQDGTWGDNEYYTGLQRKTYKHEDTNIEDIEELKEKAVEKVKEVNGTETLSVSFSSDDASLFDIVAAKEEITGISFKQPITQKILKGTIFREDKNIKIEYKVGE